MVTVVLSLWHMVIQNGKRRGIHRSQARPFRAVAFTSCICGRALIVPWLHAPLVGQADQPILHQGTRSWWVRIFTAARFQGFRPIRHTGYRSTSPVLPAQSPHTPASTPAPATVRHSHHCHTGRAEGVRHVFTAAGFKASGRSAIHRLSVHAITTTSAVITHPHHPSSSNH